MDSAKLNIIITSVFSFLLIICTSIIGIKQFFLQKHINKKQKQLQTSLAKDEKKVALYQSRMNCYLLIMNSIDIICGGNYYTILLSILSKDISFAFNNICKAKDMCYRAVIESEALFDTTAFHYIKGVYDKFYRIYEIFCILLSIPSDKWIEINEALFPLIQILIPNQNLSFSNQKDNYNDLLNKINIITSTPGSIDAVMEVLPVTIELFKLADELKLLYKPKNELYQLVYGYINFDSL